MGKSSFLFSFSPPRPFLFATSYSMQEFWGLGLNPHHSGDPSHSSDNAVSLTHGAAKELPEFPFSKMHWEARRGSRERSRMQLTFAKVTLAAEERKGGDRWRVWRKLGPGQPQSLKDQLPLPPPLPLSPAGLGK